MRCLSGPNTFIQKKKHVRAGALIMRACEKNINQRLASEGLKMGYLDHVLNKPVQVKFFEFVYPDRTSTIHM